KEGVIGAIAAVERWAGLDREAIAAAIDARLRRGRERLERLAGVTVQIELDSTSRLFSRLLVHVNPAKTSLTAYELSAALAAQKPSIAVRTLMADLGLLQIDLRRASEEVADHIIVSIE